MRSLENLVGVLALASATIAVPATGAPAKPVTIKLPVPAPIVPAILRTGAMTPQTVQLRATTPAEAEANAIWSLRAGLNVAALQCQFSPYLATVRTYNDLLKHHSAELATAQATLIAHFKRYDGTRALNSFDQYSTRIYNSYSTLDAQISFCLAAAAAGRGALLTDKAKFGVYSLATTPVLRAALAPSSGLVMLPLETIVPITEAD